jgi:hypothetical protein
MTAKPAKIKPSPMAKEFYHSTSKEQINDIRCSGCFFVIKLGIPAILAKNDREGVMLKTKHF